ncbi:MAG: di-trans,poly-cis-decaprenylcistransferase, partial [Clostridia bacterium]|nr:di-trans,poly-cis-decaprenylcistransferase [Clostridia bacterium]
MDKTEMTELVERCRIRHIAFIMDGNGRWAKARNLPREAGHVEGAKRINELAQYCKSIGIPQVTIYAFSTENWKRPEHEVNALMGLLRQYIAKGLKNLAKNETRYIFLGDKGRIEPSLRREMENLEEKSSGYSSILNIAFNYGSRSEIVRAANRLISEGKKEITEEDLSSALDTRASSDPDLIIRTAGEKRLSNFL